MQLAFQSLGLLLVGAVSVRVLLLLVAAWRQLVHKEAQRRLTLELLNSRVAAAKVLRQERERMQLSWEGYRKFVLSKKVPEALDICSFYLVPHDGKPLPTFQPGQYLTFKLNIPNRSKPLIRCYSLSDSPNHPDFYRVSIKKLSPPPNAPTQPPGVGSSFFHDELKEGDIIDVKAPTGKFSMDIAKEAPVVLIGGGIGITPVLSMLNTLTEARSKREAWLFYGVKDSKNHAMKEHLEQLDREFDNVHLQVCYSQPSDKDVLGRDYHHKGHANLDLLKKMLPSNNYEFYICGPPAMMGAVTNDLKAWGVPDDKVFFESFGPATVKKAAPPQAAAAVPSEVTVTFAKCGKTCSWNPAVGSLLDFAEANGVTVEFGCRAGNCGTCKVAVKSGEVTYLTPPGEMPEARSCLTCISVPKGNLVLDA